MPVSAIIALFAAGLAILAMGSPFGALFLTMGAIAISLKLGMPVVTDRDDRVRARSRADHRNT